MINFVSISKEIVIHPFYNSLSYCYCLADFGKAWHLGKNCGYLIQRRVPECNHKDLIYPYPMFSVTNEESLLSSLRGSTTSDCLTATIVTDPSDDVVPSYDKWDLCLKWKTHLILDSNQPKACSFSNKVSYYSKRSSCKLGYDVRFVRDRKLDYLAEWLTLWDRLVTRHGLFGLKALSEEYFRRLFALDEPLLAVLFNDSGVHSIHIWITQGDVAHSHLHASDAAAYESSANYLLYSTELIWLTENGYRKCFLGSSSGSNLQDGLFTFKKQFSNSSCVNHLLGLIVNHDEYRLLTGSSRYEGGYFPSYRERELL